MITLLLPQDGYVFNTHTPIQKEYISRIHSSGTESALAWLATVKNGECSYPQRLELAWQGGNAPYTVEVSETRDFTAPHCYRTNENSVFIDNLKIDTEYFWRVNGSNPRKFQTVGNCPRFIRLDGALNVRDLGGNKIKQGLVYRGTAIDGPYFLSDTGKKAFQDELKIKTEIELRENADPEKTTAFADSIARIYAPYRPYMEVFEEKHKAGIRKIIEVFTDESRYPIYINCMGGADRTGMIALYLRAIAGESDEDIHIDYELTALSTYAAGAAEGADGFRSRNKPYYRDFLDELQKYAPGQSISACAKTFLLSCGVTQAQIEKIQSIIKK